MKSLKRDDVEIKQLPGRMLQLVTGKEGAVIPSSVMTMGFARYSEESGPMEPHRHAQEAIYILSAKDGWTRYGGSGDKPNELGDPIPLEAGMILHFPESEWHVFEYKPGGHVDIIFFYSQSDVYSKK